MTSLILIKCSFKPFCKLSHIIMTNLPPELCSLTKLMHRKSEPPVNFKLMIGGGRGCFEIQQG